MLVTMDETRSLQLYIINKQEREFTILNMTWFLEREFMTNKESIHYYLISDFAF